MKKLFAFLLTAVMVGALSITVHADELLFSFEKRYAEDGEDFSDGFYLGGKYYGCAPFLDRGFVPDKAEEFLSAIQIDGAKIVVTVAEGAHYFLGLIPRGVDIRDKDFTIENDEKIARVEEEIVQNGEEIHHLMTIKRRLIFDCDKLLKKYFSISSDGGYGHYALDDFEELYFVGDGNPGGDYATVYSIEVIIPGPTDFSIDRTAVEDGRPFGDGLEMNVDGEYLLLLDRNYDPETYAAFNDAIQYKNAVLILTYTGGSDSLPELKMNNRTTSDFMCNAVTVIEEKNGVKKVAYDGLRNDMDTLSVFHDGGKLLGLEVVTDFDRAHPQTSAPNTGASLAMLPAVAALCVLTVFKKK